MNISRYQEFKCAPFKNIFAILTVSVVDQNITSNLIISINTRNDQFMYFVLNTNYTHSAVMTDNYSIFSRQALGYAVISK
jgi:hypothetical protein